MTELAAVKRNLLAAGLNLSNDPQAHWILPDGTGVDRLNVRKKRESHQSDHWEAAVHAGYASKSLLKSLSFESRAAEGFIEALLLKGWIRQVDSHNWHVWCLDSRTVREIERRVASSNAGTVYIDVAGSGVGYAVHTDVIDECGGRLQKALRQGERHKLAPARPAELRPIV